MSVALSLVDFFLRERLPMTDNSPGSGSSSRETVKCPNRVDGGKFLAGGPGTSLEGAPPATRVTIQMWDSLEKAQAWRNEADYKKAREIGDKYAKFRATAVEAMPQ